MGFFGSKKDILMGIAEKMTLGQICRPNAGENGRNKIERIKDIIEIKSIEQSSPLHEEEKDRDKIELNDTIRLIGKFFGKFLRK